MNLFNQIRTIAKKIPKGKVTTYGAIARAIGTRDSRLVGWAMHGNKDPQVPCHRVVFQDGSLAPNYAFGGPDEQRKRLETEGVKFLKDKVDLKNYLWQPELTC